jgi:hypothetical protein
LLEEAIEQDSDATSVARLLSSEQGAPFVCPPEFTDESGEGYRLCRGDDKLHWRCPIGWSRVGNGVSGIYDKPFCKRHGDGCSNRDDSCIEWARVGECDKNKVFMHGNCAQACGKCAEGEGGHHAFCGNRDAKCNEWAGKGECDKNAAWMGSNCAKACGKCSIHHPRNILGAEMGAGEHYHTPRRSLAVIARALAEGSASAWPFTCPLGFHDEAGAMYRICRGDDGVGHWT